MKISTKRKDVLCLSRNARQCMLQVNGNTLQQVDKFAYLTFGWHSRVTEGGARKLIHGLVELTLFFVNYSLCGHKTGSFKHRKAVSF